MFFLNNIYLHIPLVNKYSLFYLHLNSNELVLLHRRLPVECPTTGFCLASGNLTQSLRHLIRYVIEFKFTQHSIDTTVLRLLLTNWRLFICSVIASYCIDSYVTHVSLWIQIIRKLTDSIQSIKSVLYYTHLTYGL